MYVECSRMFFQLCACGECVLLFQLCACGECVLLARREPLISGMDYIVLISNVTVIINFGDPHGK